MTLCLIDIDDLLKYKTKTNNNKKQQAYLLCQAAWGTHTKIKIDSKKNIYVVGNDLDYTE